MALKKITFDDVLEPFKFKKIYNNVEDFGTMGVIVMIPLFPPMALMWWFHWMWIQRDGEE